MLADRGLPVLIVDDHQTMLRIIRTLLQGLGFADVDEATDGGSALLRLREKRYGLVISDWSMQPMTGFDLLREVRRDSALKDMPFIMATAEGKAGNVSAAREAGVSGYIVKPFTALALRAAISAVLGHA